MSSILVQIVVVPGVIASLLLAIFTFLYRQTRDRYFRAWQLGWAAYVAHFLLLSWNFFGHRNVVTAFFSDFTFCLMAWSVLRSTRLMRNRQPFRWFDAAFLAIASAWSVLGIFLEAANSAVPPTYRIGPVRIPFLHFGFADLEVPYLQIEIGIGLTLAVSAYRFFAHGARRGSTGFRLLGGAVGFWAFLLLLVPFHGLLEGPLAAVGHFLGPLPQMLLAIAQVMVLFERERRSVQENLLAFSVFDVDHTRSLTPAEVAPAMQQLLDGLAKTLDVEMGVMCIAQDWRSHLPSVHRGISAEALAACDHENMVEFLKDLATRRGGLASLRDLDEPGLLVQEHVGSFEKMRRWMLSNGCPGVTIANLQTRERCFGCIVLPHQAGIAPGPAQLRLLLGLATQIALTLENYVLMHDARRRTKEYELLTHVGQVVSSHLDADEVLLAFQRELGQLFDTSNMYVAFLDGNTVRFDLEVINNVVQPKRSRPAGNFFTEHVIRTGRPLLIRSEVEKVRAKLGCVAPPLPAKCLAMVPIVMYDKPAGVMAAINHEREFMYSDRDIEVLTTAAGQVAVAMENARLFSEEQRRARYLAFLNNVSKTAISSQHAEPLLAEIVSEIQKNFRFDHIGIGILDYATKDIEIKAEAGTSVQALGRRVSLGTGIMGRVARSNEMALIQNSGEEKLGAILDDARSVLSIPIAYGESLLGVLNVESRREDAFGQQEVLILRTLADLLATALHNAFVFQKLQQQSITDGLTGIKTRRFFVEALQSEWKRASRSGRPFSVVLMDLDKFKSVNDNLGHLEGDLVLARVGRLLEQKCRQSNVVARYGGDEFVILMPETSLEQAQVLSERLRLWVATDPMLNEMHITGSFGVASFPTHGATAEEVLRVADAGMYASKHAGGDKVATVEDFGDAATSHRQLVSAFIEGFLQREHYGPELADELVQRLHKLSAAVEGDAAPEALCEAVLTLARAAESREMHATGHGDIASRTAETIGRALDLPADELNDVIFAARVHDVGKILIPERILNKNGPLTADEKYLLKMHASIGGEIAAAIPGAHRVAQYIRGHHERFDGSGYPDGLHGEQISLGARILAVAEVYANMVLDRPYAPAMSRDAAAAALEAASGTQLDGMLVRMLLREFKPERTARAGL